MYWSLMLHPNDRVLFRLWLVLSLTEDEIFITLRAEAATWPATWAAEIIDCDAVCSWATRTFACSPMAAISACSLAA
jgi:hypothetical protein